ncbi:MAG: ADP-ribosylglycohydrolase family protein [Planctomycetaceae bacterium]
MKLKTDDQTDRIRGVLAGLAAGDFHGGPVRMGMRLAESLADHNGFHRDDVMDRYMAWYREGSFDTGPVADRVFARVQKGQAVDDAVKAVHLDRNQLTGGCNPAHRAVALAMCSAIPVESLAGAAFQEASLTHFDSIAGDVSAAVVVLCRHLILGSTWSQALDAAKGNRDPATKDALAVIPEAQLDRGGYTPHVLAAAIYFLDRHQTLRKALDAAYEFAGRWNFCPVLVGAIGGARWGASSVPVDRIRHTEPMPRVNEATERLLASWGTRTILNT